MKALELLALVREKPCEALHELSRLFNDASMLAEHLFRHHFKSISDWERAVCISKQAACEEPVSMSAAPLTTGEMRDYLTVMRDHLDLWDHCGFREQDYVRITACLQETGRLLEEKWSAEERKAEAKAIVRDFERSVPGKKIKMRMERGRKKN